MLSCMQVCLGKLGTLDDCRRVGIDTLKLTVFPDIQLSMTVHLTNACAHCCSNVHTCWNGANVQETILFTWPSFARAAMHSVTTSLHL